MKNSMFSIKNDIVFKAVFGRDDPRCKFILKDLLNAILELKDEKAIKEIEYKNPFNLQEITGDKLTIMDLKVQTGTNEWIDIEMQVNAHPDYRKRSLYYWSCLYKDSLQATQKFYELKKCVVINILDKKIIDETDDFHSCFGIMEKKKLFEFNEDLSLHFIELENFDDNQQVINLTDLEEWVMYLKDEGNEDKNHQIEEIMSKKEAIKVANQVLNEVTSDDKMREMIQSVENARRDQMSREHYAELRGLNIGREQGRKVGRDEGVAIGLSRTLKIIDAIKSNKSEDEIMSEFEMSKEQLDEVKMHIL